MAVEIGNTVTMHYKGTFDDGVAFDSSKGRDPLSFKIGAGRVVPGFERNIIGMQKGEKKSFKVAPKEGYGERRADLIQEIPKKKFPENMELKKGMVLTMEKGKMQIPTTVVEIRETTITLDFNHPLTGKNLNFEVEVLEIE